MNILITGARGFIGKNLLVALKNIRDDKDKTRRLSPDLVIWEYGRDTCSELLDEYCSKADFVFNLAGVNRPKEQAEFTDGNSTFVSELLDKLERHAILSHIYMLIVIPVSWTIFNISDLPTLGNYIKRLFFLPVKGSVKIDTFPKFLELFGTYWWLLAICAICCTPIPIRLLKRFYKTWVCKILMLALFWLSVYQIASGANNPFLYFRF